MSIALLRQIGVSIGKLTFEPPAARAIQSFESQRRRDSRWVSPDDVSSAVGESRTRTHWRPQQFQQRSARASVAAAADGSRRQSFASPSTGSSNIKMPHIEPQLNAKDKSLVRLFMASCFHKWELLEGLGKNCYTQGCSIQEVRGCVRHLIVVAGYGPCLAATLHLHKAKLLPEETPGKVGGPPGNAFELVYGPVTDKVRHNMHAADPVLGELIRLHLYGDIYSSPGITLRQKQLLMVSFLGQANMHDQLYGHLIAAFRFGVLEEEALKAIDCAFELAPVEEPEVYRGSMKTLALAIRKHRRGSNAGDESGEPQIHIPDPASVRHPLLPALVNGPAGDHGADSATDSQRAHDGGDADATSALERNTSEDLESPDMMAAHTALSRTVRTNKKADEGN